jgi:hypothetical protein
MPKLEIPDGENPIMELRAKCLHIQRDSPGPEKEAHWLPVPNDTVSWSCASAGRRPECLPFCPPAKALGTHRVPTSDSG